MKSTWVKPEEEDFEQIVFCEESQCDEEYSCNEEGEIDEEDDDTMSQSRFYNYLPFLIAFLLDYLVSHFFSFARKSSIIYNREKISHDSFYIGLIVFGLFFFIFNDGLGTMVFGLVLLYVGIESYVKGPKKTLSFFSAALLKLALWLVIAVMIGSFLDENSRTVNKATHVNVPKCIKEETTTPVIGILTVPVEHSERGRECVSRRRLLDSSLDEHGPTSCFNNVYARWLEGSGAQVVPIPYDLEQSKIDELLSSINGVLFTGGEVPLREPGNSYVATARYIFDKVIDINRAGEHFPLWGTCMGLQLLSVLAGGPEVLEFGKFQGVEGVNLRLNFSKQAMQSPVFATCGSPGLVSRKIYKILASSNVATNYHHDGVDPQTFVNNKGLSSLFNVLATNVDAAGQPFVSMIEAKGLPIYGVQFHPERAQYDFRGSKDPVNHSMDAVASNAYFSSFFVAQARGNTRSFPSDDSRESKLIWNYVPSTPSGHGNYLFP